MVDLKGAAGFRKRSSNINVTLKIARVARVAAASYARSTVFTESPDAVVSVA
jgi:hypothetical protein